MREREREGKRREKKEKKREREREREGLKFQVCVPKVSVKTLFPAPESI